MWRRLLYNSQLRTLRSRRSASTVNRFASADVSYSPPPSRRSLALISRHFSSDSAAESVGSKKRVEDVMPIATGHEREELEAELEGRKLLDVNYPVGPFGTKIQKGTFETGTNMCRTSDEEQFLNPFSFGTYGMVRADELVNAG